MHDRYEPCAGPSRLSIAALALLLLLPLFLAASPAGATEANAGEAPVVYTRAEVRSFFEEASGKFYVRLKLLPRAKIPFTTQAFLVTDRSLLAGIPEGASVKFTSRHRAGENTLTSIQVVEPCRRFQRCDD